MLELAREFVCAADEVWRLQRGSDEDCVFFQRMVNGGQRITDRGTRQGTWLCTANGRLIARFNTRNVEHVVQTLQGALETWRGLPEEKHELPPRADFEPAHRWESNYPAGGLVLERIAREAGAEGLEGERGVRWNRDFAWFSRAEVAALAPQPEADSGAGLAVGSVWDFAALAQRLARFHLVDNVNGQTIPFAQAELRGARLSGTVHAREGPRVELVLAGVTSADSAGTWLLGENLWTPNREWPHAMDCELFGRAVFDTSLAEFVELELVALGRRRGRTQNNGRRAAPEEGRVAFHFQLDRSGVPVAPTFIALYDADWLVAPDVATWRLSPAECGLSEE